MFSRVIAPGDAWGARDPLAWGLLLAVWMLAHPYAGIRHDGIFYAVDAMYRLDPSILGQDLFFLAGSPFDASVFGEVYAGVIAVIGMVPASWVLYVAAQLLWAAAAIAWAARFLPSRAFLVGAACLALLPRSYGSGLVFKLAESQVTARSFAEPLALLALLAIARSRPVAGLALLAAAALVHPIMASPALIAGAWLLMGQLRLSLAVRAAMVAVCFAAVFVIAASGALGTMDGGWLEATRERNPFILPSEWDLEYLARIGAPILILIAASLRLAPGLRELAAAIAIAASSGIALALIGESQGAAILLQVQPWRATWVALWAAPFAAAAVACSTWDKNRGASLMFLAVLPASIVSFYGPSALFSWLVLLHAASIGLWLRMGLQGRLWRHLGAAWLGLFGILASVHLVAVVYMLFLRPETFGTESVRSVHEVLAVSLGCVLAPAVLLLLLRLLLRSSGSAPGIALGSAALTLAASVVMLDGRSEEMRQREAWIRSGLPQVQAAIGDSELLFWPENVASVWLAVGRPSYVSVEQLAAQMFDRKLSEEGRRRLDLVGALGGKDGLLNFYAVRSRMSPRSLPDPAAALRLCADRPTMALVLGFPMAGIPSDRVSIDAGMSVWVTRCAGVGVSLGASDG